AEDGASRPKPAALLAAAWGPALACGIGLLLYNWLRFRSLGEFGLHYQLAGENPRTESPLFGGAHLVANARQYLLSAGIWQRYFPFFGPVPGAPYGLLRYLPWAWLAPAAFLGSRRDRDRAALAVAVGWAALSNLALLCLFRGVNDRYACDY